MAFSDDKTLSNPPIPLLYPPFLLAYMGAVYQLLMLMGAGVVVLVVLGQGHVRPFLYLPPLCSTRG